MKALVTSKGNTAVVDDIDIPKPALKEIRSVLISLNETSDFTTTTHPTYMTVLKFTL